MSKRALSVIAKAVGAPYVDPIPPDQYLWMQKQGEPPLYRLWSWMIYSTMHWGRDSAFAVSRDGDELHLVHAAKDLEIAETNLYKYWKEGLLRGLWRNGTKAEGNQRLYLCGKVQPVKDDGEKDDGSLEEEHEIICTYNLTPYIYQKIKEWSSEKREKFLAERLIEVRVQKDSFAEVVAGVRTILNQFDDTWFSERGLEKRRAPRAKPEVSQDEPSHPDERSERLSVFLPHVQKFVQIIRTSVQSAPPELYKPDSKNGTESPTLLRSEKSQKKPDARAGVNSDASSRSLQSSHSDDGKKLNQLPALSLTPAEKEAEKLCLKRFLEMQQSFPHTRFSSQLISPSKKNDQLLVHRVLYAVGIENLEDFLSGCWKQFKGQDKNALGKLPGRAPGTEKGPRNFGLILEWAKDYGEHLAEAARSSAEERARFRSQEIQAMRDLLADPNEPEDMKAHWREMLRSYAEQTKGAQRK